MPRLPPYGFVTSDSIVETRCRSLVPMIECYHMYSIRTSRVGVRAYATFLGMRQGRRTQSGLA